MPLCGRLFSEDKALFLFGLRAELRISSCRRGLTGKTGSRAQGVERERWMRRDWIRAGMVGSGASRVGGWPRSRRVWEVMGPMVARVMVGGRGRLAASRRAMRLRAGEALGKGVASGGGAGGARVACRGGGVSWGVWLRAWSAMVEV